MIRQTAPKVAILAILAVVSWFCTSKIIAQSRPPKTKAQQGQTFPNSTKGATSGASTKMDGDIPVDRTGEVPAKILADFRLEDMRVDVAGGKAFVHARVRMQVNDPGRSYVWGLRVDGPSKEIPVLSSRYTHQTFSVNLGEVFSPTFDETIMLAPGAYKVKVTLYDFPPGADVSDSNKGGVVISGIQDIVVQ